MGVRVMYFTIKPNFNLGLNYTYNAIVKYYCCIFVYVGYMLFPISYMTKSFI